jgi:glycosyltransferase involved in cell wall biosynthesis
VQCIIVENGSNFLEDMNGSISIIHSEKGLSVARNAGIRASLTEFFLPLDANDWLPENAVETLYNKRADKGFTYGSTMLFNQARGMGDQHLYEAKPYDFSEIMKMVYFPNSALQRRTDWELIGGYREALPFLEDWDYWMTAGELGVCGTAISETTLWYRQHGGMVATNNHTPEWERVRKLIQSFHQDIYKGDFPPMCCGNDRPKRNTVYVPPTIEQLNAPGAEGMILIEYIGGNSGKMPWYGAFTQTRYIVGGSQKRLYIDVRDAITGLKKNPGFLEVIEHGNPLFKQVEV